MNAMNDTIHFLITYDHDARRQISMEQFTDDEAAVGAYGDREREFEDNPRIEVVLLGADSEDAIRVTHPNYFEEARTLRIKDVMKTEVVCVKEDETLQVALEAMGKYGYDQVPVEDATDGTLVGAISTRWLIEDGIRAESSEASSTKAYEVMRHKSKLPEGMVRIGGNDPVACKAIDDYYFKNDFILVIDEEDKIQGIAQQWDVKQFQHLL